MSRKKPTFTLHRSFDTILDRYDAFILDQFGVLHNGKHALDGAIETLTEMVHPQKKKDTHHHQQKKIIILSNTSSSEQSALSRLPTFGFRPEDLKGQNENGSCYGAVTSGEEAARYIVKVDDNDDDAKTVEEGRKKVTRKIIWITWASPRSPSPMDFLDRCHALSSSSGSDITILPTLSPSEADLVVVHGADCFRGPGEDGEAEEVSFGGFQQTGEFTEALEGILGECLENELEMVCANPDFVVVKPDGSRGHMPGKIAKRYEEMGGKCHYFGKPHVSHFETCVKRLNIPKNRICHVGDSIHHDVIGAINSGVDVAFVVGGIHREDLGCDLGMLPDESKLISLLEKECPGISPTHVVPMFKLGDD